jgi:hypothetical protein
LFSSDRNQIERKKVADSDRNLISKKFVSSQESIEEFRIEEV